MAVAQMCGELCAGELCEGTVRGGTVRGGAVGGLLPSSMGSCLVELCVGAVWGSCVGGLFVVAVGGGGWKLCGGELWGGALGGGCVHGELYFIHILYLDGVIHGSVQHFTLWHVLVNVLSRFFLWFSQTKHFECHFIQPPQEVQCVHMYSVAGTWSFVPITI